MGALTCDAGVRHPVNPLRGLSTRRTPGHKAWGAITTAGREGKVSRGRAQPPPYVDGMSHDPQALRCVGMRP